MASSPQHPDPLQPVLRDAEAELTRRLHEACEAESRGVTNESAARIRQLEDALLAAAAAAEHTLSLRRRIDQRQSTTGTIESPPVGTAAAGGQADGPSAPTSFPTGTVREFTDKNGQAWRAWPVTPGHSRTGQTKHFLGDFQLGWICFEGVHDSSRRRLAGHPPGWTELSEPELGDLLERSVAAKERKSVGPVPNEARPG